MKILGHQLTWEEELHLFKQPASLQFLTFAGSIAHGTKDPANQFSDTDLKGVYVSPRAHYLGLKQESETRRTEMPEQKIDVEIHDIRKFMNLVLSCNPTILEMLYVDPSMHLRISKAFKGIVEKKESFLSKRAHKTFMGYATQQFVKMKAGETNRDMGAKRKDLVDKFGYDTKNAMHLFRLLHMGLELMRTGTMTVKRPNAQFLKSIRAGAWTLEQVKAEAEDLMQLFREAEEESVLPDEPDWDFANWLTQDIIMMYHDLGVVGDSKYY